MRKLTLDNWQLKQRDDGVALDDDFASQQGWIAAPVPGSVHEALLAAGLIPDPFVGTNENDVQWVGERDWLYRCSFDLTEGFGARQIALCLDGLDTFATVWLNGRRLLSSDNMWLPQRVEVRQLLRSSGNQLRILFESAWRRGREIEAQHERMDVWNTDPSRVYVRKAQYHYGWDWGPKLLASGPWLPVRLEAHEARITDLRCDVEVAGDLKRARVGLTLAVDRARPVTLRAELFDPDGMLVAQSSLSVDDDAPKATLDVRQPRLWWPNGHGEQPLYRLVVTLLETQLDGAVLDCRELRLGLRRLRLVREPVAGEDGDSFVFELNNTPIFAGGANWIPADSFTPRIDEARYRGWLTLARDANMNMLRVWGGGIYEHDIFYDLCDELGLLVWQDFMFGCGRYPAYPEFQASVRAEAEAQVRRLRHHACMALWCGNNEDYQLAYSLGLYDWQAPPDADSAFPARVIYELLLPAVVSTLDGSTPYVAGSPFGGPDANSAVTGDRHVWGIWHGDMAPYQEYPAHAGRFVSEFGMAALPARATIESFTRPEERTPRHPTLAFHHKASGGDERLEHYMAANTGIPAELETYIYASQVVQAEAMAAAYTGWRRRWNSPGRRATAGALVWQLDDCWPAISWAVVDYRLRPKAALYAIRRALAPLTIGLRRGADGVEAWVVNGTQTDASLRLELRVVALDGSQVSSQRFELSAEPNSVLELGISAQASAEQVVAARLLANGEVVARTVDWPQPLHQAALGNPAISIERQGEQLRMRAARPAKAVWLDAGDGIGWSDNGFDLVPGDEYIIQARGLGEGAIRITSLIDIL